MEMSEHVLKQLQWRYATKKFDPTKKIPDHLWQVLEQSLVLAPSSFGLQPWKFIEVRNPEVRQKLLEYSWKQTQVVDASHLVVFAIRKNIDAAEVDRYLERMSEVQGTPIDALQGFGNVVKNFLVKPPYPLNMDEWSARQLYLALGEFMTCAAMLNIDTCPMEGLSPTKYDEVLGLTDYATVVACPAGYRAEDDKSAPASRPKVRYKLEDVIQYID